MGGIAGTGGMVGSEGISGTGGFADTGGSAGVGELYVLHGPRFIHETHGNVHTFKGK